MTQSSAQLDDYLSRFRLSAFRPGQEDVIRTVLEGRDCLCVMPTGGGKSLCYQLPALALDGLTIVVSPLIALMKDQVDQLRELGLPVTYINSTLTPDEQSERLRAVASGEIKMVYAVPERFRSPRFLEAVQAAGLKLLAIDEAHCISQWGHDFRPDYAKLGHFREALGNPPTIALTATATGDVRQDIIDQLKLDEPETFIRGFARDNLFYRVWKASGERDKLERLVEFLERTPGTGIIYASTRRRTEELAEALGKRLRRRVIAYHAGLLPEPRKSAQEAFMRGDIEIIVATTAFGMGIDKADVRFVVHYNLPGTIEGYYQEAGRAGRDGLPSECLLLYNASDRYIQEWFIESAYPGPENVELVYEYLASVDADPIQLTQQEIKERLALPIGPDGVGTCEQLLESAGVLQRLVASENRATVQLGSQLPTLVDLLPKRAKVRRTVLRALEQIVGSRRNEPVSFEPVQLLRLTGLEQTSIATALRELNELDAFDYVPPFRGRAIRMLDRETPFEQLDIDFESIERRKAYEYEKLNRVIQFALNATCRQKAILHYFGETNGQDCGHCDNCERHGQGGSPHVPAELNDEALKTIRIALSGVARVQKRFRCGKNLIAQMLCGSKAARIAKLGLDQLSTFGLLEHLTQVEVAELLEALIVTRYLTQVDVDQHRPVLELTPEGVELMKGQREFEGTLPLPDYLLAKIRGNQTPPASPTQTEPATAQRRPQSPRPTEELAKRKGLPHRHASLHDPQQPHPRRTRGRPTPNSRSPPRNLRNRTTQARPTRPRILELITEHSSSNQPEAQARTEVPTSHQPEAQARTEDIDSVAPSEAQPHIAPDSSPPPAPSETTRSTPSDRPSCFWTWRMTQLGLSVEEIAAARNMTPESVRREQDQAARLGFE